MRKRKPSELPFYQRLLVGVDETCEQLGVGRNSVYNLINAGKLQVVKVGPRTLITTASILALATAEAA